MQPQWHVSQHAIVFYERLTQQDHRVLANAVASVATNAAALDANAAAASANEVVAKEKPEKIEIINHHSNIIRQHQEVTSKCSPFSLQSSICST